MLDWPDALCPIRGGFAPFIRSLSGGQSLSGFEQVQPQLHDRWSASFSFHVSGKDQIFALRSMITGLRGRSGTILVPTFEDTRAPLSAATPGAPLGDVLVNPQFWRRWPDLADTEFEFSTLPAVTGNATILSSTAFSFTSSGTAPQIGQYVTLYSKKRAIQSITGSGPYYIVFEPALTVAADTPGTVAAIAGDNAAINATLLYVHVTTGTAPLAGNYFSIGNRLYTISSVDDLGLGVYGLDIWPWLRAAVAISDPVNFSTPACEMRLASDAEGADTLRSLMLRKYGDVTLSFDEVAVSP